MARAIERHTRVDGFRGLRRINSRELTGEEFDALTLRAEGPSGIPDLDIARLIDRLPQGQREAVRMLKFSGLSLEEVARKNHSTIGAAKQKARRAYGELRSALRRDAPASAKREGCASAGSTASTWPTSASA